MFSTRIATRAVRLAAEKASSSKATFSTTSAAFSRREVLVQLTSDVDGLGFTNDRVLVSPGRARNQLIPGRVARFVPWKKASDKEPRAVTREEVAARTASSTIASALSVHMAIAALPSSISFSHRATSRTASSIFGSVTLADVTRRLEAHGLPSSGVAVSWVGQDDAVRVKQLGTYTVDVRYSGSEAAPALGSVEALALAEAGPGRATITVDVVREA